MQGQNNIQDHNRPLVIRDVKTRYLYYITVTAVSNAMPKLSTRSPSPLGHTQGQNDQQDHRHLWVIMQVKITNKITVTYWSLSKVKMIYEITVTSGSLYKVKMTNKITVTSGHYARSK